MTQPTPTPTPPAHLRIDGKRFWREMTDDYGFDVSELKLLTLLCEQIDLEADATRTIKKLGSTYDKDGTLKVRPEVEVQRQSARLISMLIRQIAIPQTEPVEPQRTRQGTFGKTPRGHGRVARAKAAV
jgi:phage terminase small subunit